MDHMTTVHQLNMLRTKVAEAKSASCPTEVCPVISCLRFHSPGLDLPSIPSLTQLQCLECRATVFKVNSASEQTMTHHSSCDSKQLVLQCRLCLISLPDTQCGAAQHFK
eukprot:GFUD01107455.1.p1 GENE.GFUD01107455.1~~GFUD01107455.1.p1  ORF type:complete len:109 (+),score=32.40 GFUD01107455.1:1-327(+)